MKSKAKIADLETSLGEIASIIEHMEKGDLTLEQSLTHFERGIGLIKQAQNMLQLAEQKVQLLLKNNDNEALVEYKDNEIK